MPFNAVISFGPEAVGVVSPLAIDAEMESKANNP